MRITWLAKAASQMDFIGYANRDAKHAEMVKYLSISEGHGISMDQRVHPVKIIRTGECNCDTEETYIHAPKKTCSKDERGVSA